MQKSKSKKESFPEPRINEEITFNGDVRVIYAENGETKNDVMPLFKAKRLSDRLELDLIEINGNTNPPILRIDNYEKWLYNEKKKRKENKQKKVELKEIQLSANISQNDLKIKADKAKEFIADGNKVKVVLTLKGREKMRMEECKRSLYEFILLMEDVATPESMPKDEGAKSIVILRKKK